MNFKKIIVAVASTAIVLSTGTMANAESKNIVAGGSSFSAGLFTVCAANYRDANVTYTSSSSGTGRTNFLNGTFDFAGTDAPYEKTDAQPDKNSFKYIPVTGGPIAIVYNLPTLNGLKIDANIIGKIWTGKITKWNDPAIVSLNKNTKLPNLKIVPQYRNDKSGTNANFSGYLAGNKVSGFTKDQTWTNVIKNTKPVGTGSPGSMAIVSNIKTTLGAIGYVDLKDAMSSGLKQAALKNGAGQFIKPTSAASSKFLASQPIAENGIVSIDWSKKVPGGYNASAITYAIVNTGLSKSNGVAVRDFITYMLKTCVPSNANKLGYVALSGSQSTKAKDLVTFIK